MIDAAIVERRKDVLAEYFRLHELRQGMQKSLLTAAEPDVAELSTASEAVLSRLHQLRNEYRTLLDMVSLSRCPFCNEITKLSFDPHGLDGLYWDYDAPISRPDPRPCAHFVVLAGAIKLSVPLARLPMLSVPGPEVPWVVPRLLRLSMMRAVVATVPVGSHTGFPIAYFADPDPRVDLINSWGRSYYETVDASGARGWNEVFEDDADFDFDLRSWMDQGRLMWIAPGDDQFVLRKGGAGSPYLDMPGRRGVVKVQYGISWVHGWEVKGQL